eukprot:TRINITY_DN9623_c0_g1_i1.p1 TRINITY_DN9623_c0_g1~~TRINITY_DN9623_c0_g1_i1.p1  ORF type:complete len:737 (+),score=129.47 TRINITY_DN9623_c0_g1_i1:63-2273(+)
MLPVLLSCAVCSARAHQMGHTNVRGGVDRPLDLRADTRQRGILDMVASPTKAGYFGVAVNTEGGRGVYFYMNYEPHSMRHVAGVADDSMRRCDGFQRNYDLLGEDYRVDEAEELVQPCVANGDCPCQEACNRDRRCVAWTLVPEGTRFGTPRCCLKHRVPRGTRGLGLLSGVKDPVRCRSQSSRTVSHDSANRIRIQVELGKVTKVQIGDQKFTYTHAELPTGDVALRSDEDVTFHSVEIKTPDAPVEFGPPKHIKVRAGFDRAIKLDRLQGEVSIAFDLKSGTPHRSQYGVLVNKDSDNGVFFYAESRTSHLKVGAAKRVPRGCQRFMMNWDVGGTEYKALPLDHTLDASCSMNGRCACQAACEARKSDCRSWTLVPDSHTPHGEPRCILKSSVGKGRLAPGLISGAMDPLECSSDVSARMLHLGPGHNVMDIRLVLSDAGVEAHFQRGAQVERWSGSVNDVVLRADQDTTFRVAFQEASRRPLEAAHHGRGVQLEANVDTLMPLPPHVRVTPNTDVTAVFQRPRSLTTFGIVLYGDDGVRMHFFLRGPRNSKGLFEAGIRSSLCKTFMNDVDLAGGDVQVIPSTRSCVGDSNCDCQRRCARSRECKAWTVVPPGSGHGHPRCCLKSELPRASHAVGLISGIKNPADCPSTKATEVVLPPEEDEISLHVSVGEDSSTFIFQRRGMLTTEPAGGKFVGTAKLRSDTDLQCHTAEVKKWDEQARYLPFMPDDAHCEL